MSLLVLLIVSTGIACVCAADSHNATVDKDSIQITDANPISFNASNDQQDVNSSIHDARVIDNTDSYAPHGRVDSLSQDNVSQASNQKEDRLDQAAVVKNDDSTNVVKKSPGLKYNDDEMNAKFHDELTGYYKIIDNWTDGFPDFILFVYKDHSWKDTVWIVHKLMVRQNKHTPYTLEKVEKVMEKMRNGKMVHFSPDSDYGDYDYYAGLMKLYEDK